MTTDTEPAEVSKHEVPTKERLALALEALGDPALAGMIQKAREGFYDDYLSPLATPVGHLVHDLIAHNRRAFAERVIDGEFDGTEAEGQAWYEREARALIERVSKLRGAAR